MTLTSDQIARNRDLIARVSTAIKDGHTGVARNEIAERVNERSEPWLVALAARAAMQSDQLTVQDKLAEAFLGLDAGYPLPAAEIFMPALRDPSTRERAIELYVSALDHGLVINDPVVVALQLVQEMGDPNAAERLLRHAIPIPTYEFDGWERRRTAGTEAVEALRETRAIVDRDTSTFKAEVEESLSAVKEQRALTKTATGQFLQFIADAGSYETKTVFDAAAKKAEKEAGRYWTWGLRIFSVAAVLAVLPLLLHYCRVGPHMSTTQLISAHIASAIAISAGAGLLLSRARSRDRIEQRANALSIALGTTFIYANRIADPDGKEAFLSEMVKAVLQAHLQTQPEPSEIAHPLATLRPGS